MGEDGQEEGDEQDEDEEDDDNRDEEEEDTSNRNFVEGLVDDILARNSNQLAYNNERGYREINPSYL